MPSRNVTKEQAPESFYHVYARGSNKQKLFLDDADYKYFLSLFDRYLSKKQKISKTGEPYPHFLGMIEIIAYCLMTNHFHMFVYQKEVPNLEKFMRSLMTSYSRYFNLKYKRSGPVYESRYKAVRIDKESYYQHITRYIHLNPRLWQTHRYSSIKFYEFGNEPEWLKPDKVLSDFSSRGAYMSFVSDYEELRDILSELKYQLADQ